MNDITMTLGSPDVALVGGRGSLTVSVTNVSAASQRIVLGAFPTTVGNSEASTGEGTPSPTPIATVDRPLRTVEAGATEQYTVAFDVSQSASGEYPVRLVGYSADRAPEEYADQAHTVTLTVPAAPEPAKKAFPWWIVILAGALMVVAAIVVVVLVVMGTDPDEVQPSAPPSPSPTSVAPVSITVSITGGGTIIVAGTACSSDCTVVVPSATDVTPSQAASFAHVFDGWGGDCPSASDCTLTPTSDISIKAAFRSIPVSAEDCRPYNRDALAIVDRASFPFFPQEWHLVDGADSILELDDKSDARAALAVAQFYTSRCVIGGQQADMQYWTGGGRGAPDVANPDCLSHDPGNLAIAAAGASWRLTEGSHLLATLSSEADAGRALMVARAATQRCFVGRRQPPGETEYWLPRLREIQVDQGSFPTVATDE